MCLSLATNNFLTMCLVTFHATDPTVETALHAFSIPVNPRLANRPTRVLISSPSSSMSPASISSCSIAIVPAFSPLASIFAHHKHPLISVAAVTLLPSSSTRYPSANALADTNIFLGALLE